MASLVVFLVVKQPSQLFERVAPQWSQSAVLYDDDGNASLLIRVDGPRVTAEPLNLAGPADDEIYALWAIGATEKPLLIGELSSTEVFGAVGQSDLIRGDTPLVFAISRDPKGADLSGGAIGPVVFISRDQSL